MQVGRLKKYPVFGLVMFVNKTLKVLLRSLFMENEMLFRRRTRTVILPPPLPGIERVDSMIVLGVNISYDLWTSAHVDRLLGRCTSSLHALRILRAHGLPQDALHNVAKATLLSRLLYASPSWWGMTSADERLKIER